MFLLNSIGARGPLAAVRISHPMGAMMDDAMRSAPLHG